MKCEYTYSKISLGAQAKVYFPEQKMEFSMVYDRRDGIWAQIKRKEPWRILFEYVDGVCLINDDMDRDYQQLKDALELLKSEENTEETMKIYEKLEKIMYQFIVEYL